MWKLCVYIYTHTHTHTVYVYMHNVLFIQTINNSNQKTNMLCTELTFISILITEYVDQQIRKGFLWGYAYCVMFLEGILKTFKDNVRNKSEYVCSLCWTQGDGALYIHLTP